MLYEKIVLSDGAEVLFARGHKQEATPKNGADAHQRDTTVMAAAANVREMDKEISQVSPP
jgi:hypothetical protein